MIQTRLSSGGLKHRRALNIGNIERILIERGVRLLSDLAQNLAISICRLKKRNVDISFLELGHHVVFRAGVNRAHLSVEREIR